MEPPYLDDPFPLLPQDPQDRHPDAQCEQDIQELLMMREAFIDQRISYFDAIGKFRELKGRHVVGRTATPRQLMRLYGIGGSIAQHEADHQHAQIIVREAIFIASRSPGSVSARELLNIHLLLSQVADQGGYFIETSVTALNSIDILMRLLMSATPPEPEAAATARLQLCHQLNQLARADMILTRPDTAQASLDEAQALLYDWASQLGLPLRPGTANDETRFDPLFALPPALVASWSALDCEWLYQCYRLQQTVVELRYYREVRYPILLEYALQIFPDRLHIGEACLDRLAMLAEGAYLHQMRCAPAIERLRAEVAAECAFLCRLSDERFPDPQTAQQSLAWVALANAALQRLGYPRLQTAIAYPISAIDVTSAFVDLVAHFDDLNLLQYSLAHQARTLVHHSQELMDNHLECLSRLLWAHITYRLFHGKVRKLLAHARAKAADPDRPHPLFLFLVLAYIRHYT